VRGAMRRLEAAALRLCIPGVCGLCGGAGQWDRCRGGLDLCEHCEAALPVDDVGSDGGGGGGGGGPLLAAFDYAPPVDYMIRQLKFGGDRSFARTLGILMAEARAARPGPLPDVVVPVPLHFERLRERGYNQALELARFAARTLRVPLAPRVLRRTRVTQAQSGLPAAAREANVRGCFASAGADALRAVRGRRCAVVDDVLTTGSTAREAAATLAAMGARAVEIWTAARAQRERGRGRGRYEAV